jgi:hypothetical protein
MTTDPAPAGRQEPDPRPDPGAVTTVEELLAAMYAYHEHARYAPGQTFADRSRHRSAGPGLRRAMDAAAGKGEHPPLDVLRDLLAVGRAEPEYAERFLAAWHRTGGEAQE